MAVFSNSCINVVSLVIILSVTENSSAPSKKPVNIYQDAKQKYGNLLTTIATVNENRLDALKEYTDLHSFKGGDAISRGVKNKNEETMTILSDANTKGIINEILREMICENGEKRRITKTKATTKSKLRHRNHLMPDYEDDIVINNQRAKSEPPIRIRDKNRYVDDKRENDDNCDDDNNDIRDWDDDLLDHNKNNDDDTDEDDDSKDDELYDDDIEIYTDVLRSSCWKQATKNCKKACKSALREVCDEYMCSKKMKKTFKNKCKRKCKEY